MLPQPYTEPHRVYLEDKEEAKCTTVAMSAMAFLNQLMLWGINCVRQRQQRPHFLTLRPQDYPPIYAGGLSGGYFPVRELSLLAGSLPGASDLRVLSDTFHSWWFLSESAPVPHH